LVVERAGPDDTDKQVIVWVTAGKDSSPET